MATAYRGQRQQLGGLGAPERPTGGVDVGGAIDALTGGATSLIHATMLRRQAELQNETAAEERQYQRGKDSRDMAFKKQESDRKFMLEGGVPAHDETRPDQMHQVAPPSPIARAMHPPAAPGPDGLPAPQMMSVAPPPAAAGPLRQPGMTEHVKEGYDPTRAADYVRQTETANIRAGVMREQAETKAKTELEKQTRDVAAKKQAAGVAHGHRMELQRLINEGKKQALGSTNIGGVSIRGAMTATSLNNTANSMADGVLASFGGDRQAAYEWLTTSNDEEATQWRSLSKALPFAMGNYLDAAAARRENRDAGFAFHSQGGIAGDTPAEATTRVDETRTSVRPRGFDRRAPAPAKVPAGAESLYTKDSAFSPFKGTDMGAGGGTRSVSRAKASAPADTTAKDDYTDDEMADAYEALAIGGKEPSDAEMKAHADSVRTTKKKKPTK